jgi:peptide/nickel transport system permease protein
MSAYLIRRIGSSIVVVLGVSILMFALLHWVYPSPARDVLGTRASQAALLAWNKANGYDSPFIVQYFRYIGRTLHGNLGWSYSLNQSVASLLSERAPKSIYLSGMALILSVLLAVPLGVYQAVKRNSIGDNAATGLAFVFYSMPSFLLGLVLIQVFALWQPWLNFEGSQDGSIWGIMGDWHSMTLPIVTLTLVTLASYSRYMRSASIDVLAQDYIKVSRAKGLPEKLVLWRHLLKNASLPMVTLVGLSLPLLLAGNLITEYLFNFPGLGLLFYESLQKADYNVMLAYTMMGAVLVVIGNLVADIALTVADPRIRMA